jgi:tetratricopeptide (TPR) repeat protein
MNEQRIIKVFMASSDELEGDRAVLGNLVRHLNDMYRTRGIYIELFQWEDFDASYGRGRKQDEYNEKVRESDMFLAFFHKKAGKFTIEEFDVAVSHFEQNAQPKIFTYMRDLAAEERETEDLAAFKKRLYDDMGHYWCRYGNTDTMKLHFVLQFQLQEEAKNIAKLEVKNSEVILDDQRIADLNNIPFAANNDAFREFVQRKTKLEEKIVRYRERATKDPDDKKKKKDLLEASEELNEVTKKLEQHEQFLFDIAKTLAQQVGKACSERMMKARELFEDGKASEANGILNTEDLNRDITANLNRWERDKQRVEDDRKLLLQNIEELLLKTKTALADETIKWRERCEQACQAYCSAIDLQRKLEVPREELAKTLCGSGIVHKELEDFVMAEKEYTEALEIYRTLSKQNPDAYLGYVATMLRKLGGLHDSRNYKLENFAKAEKEYMEALAIYRTLSDAYLTDVADTLIRLGEWLHRYPLKDIAKAEEELREALEIYKNLAVKHNSDKYLSKLSTISYKLGKREVFNTYKYLVKHHPNIYLPKLNDTLNYMEEKETEYLEILELYKALSEQYPDICLLGMARIFNLLGYLYKNLHDLAKSEKAYMDALKIYRILSEQEPNTYLSHVAYTLRQLGNLHKDIHDFATAEKEYTEALEIYKTLEELTYTIYTVDKAATILHRSFTTTEKKCVETLIIPLTPTTPYVCCDASTGLIEMSGRAIPFDAHNFFKPILEWLIEFQQMHVPIQVNFRFEYTNKSIRKCIIFQFMKILENIYMAGISVSIDWYYEEDDDDDVEYVKDFYKLRRYTIPLRFIEVSEDDAYTYFKELKGKSL